MVVFVGLNQKINPNSCGACPLDRAKHKHFAQARCFACMGVVYLNLFCFNINQMIKLGEVNLAILGMGPTWVAMAATDPDGRTIIEDFTPLSTSKQTLDELLVLFIAVVAIVILGSILYINKNKLFKHKKRSRKK